MALSEFVTPRMRRVSWNSDVKKARKGKSCHASHEACELKFFISWFQHSGHLSRLAWGVWVEIIIFSFYILPFMSRLAWGVWVEILNHRIPDTAKWSRLAWGVWVEILPFAHNLDIADVTPRMRRVSWNSVQLREHTKESRSRLAWGVWVEIFSNARSAGVGLSRLAWGVWVEIASAETPRRTLRSRLAWGVWVEMVVGLLVVSTAERHASHEACELKLGFDKGRPEDEPSRLAWGVWVEIPFCMPLNTPSACHASHEACELKW